MNSLTSSDNGQDLQSPYHIFPRKCEKCREGCDEVTFVEYSKFTDSELEQPTLVAKVCDNCLQEMLVDRTIIFE